MTENSKLFRFPFPLYVKDLRQVEERAENLTMKMLYFPWKRILHHLLRGQLNKLLIRQVNQRPHQQLPHQELEVRLVAQDLGQIK